MKIKLIKKATVFLMAVMMVVATATGAFALAYYESGKADWSGVSRMGLDNNGGIRTFYFMNNPISGPGSDTLVGRNQSIDAVYQIGALISGSGNTGVYSLTLSSGTYDLNVSTYLAAQAQAMTIDFANNVITWSDVTMGTINNGIGSQSLTDMQAVKTAGGTFKFSTFAFEHTEAVNTWLSTAGTFTDTKYYSKLEGFAAVPEPAEWMLMFIGLGMLGFYLQRRGYLDFDLSPQSVA